MIGGEGTDREHVLINYGRGFFVRDKEFRLNQDGKFYDIPVVSDTARYSETQSTNPENDTHRERLQAILDEFMAIKPEYKGSAATRSKGDSSRKKNKKPGKK